MGQFTLGVFINRSQQDVFDFLSDPANLSKWNSTYEAAQWTSSEAPGIGSTYKVLAKMPGGKKENGTQLTFESQFGIVGILKFAEGMFGKLAEKGDGSNLDTAKRLLEAG